jgi:CheY-like chemotaxis protein/CheY-specific phosphatase CheX
LSDDVHIKPIINEVAHTLKTMAGVEPRMIERTVRTAAPSDHDVAAVVDVTGAATGRLVLSMPGATAVRIVSRILEEEIEGVTSDVVDGIGEMGNVISARTKSALSRQGIEGLTLSLPRVVVDDIGEAFPADGFPYTSISFIGDGLGTFTVDVKLSFTPEALADAGVEPVVVKMLLVEDSAMVRKLVGNVITRMTAPRVDLHEAAAGDEALEAIRGEAGGFDVVLLDLKIPQTDGMTVLKEIKGDPATRDTKVVVLTGDVSDTTVHEAMAAGAAGFLVKPFRQAELTKLIRDVTDTPA